MKTTLTIMLLLIVAIANGQIVKEHTFYYGMKIGDGHKNVKPTWISSDELVYTSIYWGNLRIYDSQYQLIKEIPIQHDWFDENEQFNYLYLSRYLFNTDDKIEFVPVIEYDFRIYNEDGELIETFFNLEYEHKIMQTDNKAKLILKALGDDEVLHNVYSLPGNTPEYDRQISLIQQYGSGGGEPTTGKDGFPPVPEWDDTKLRFLYNTDQYTEWVDLKGEKGDSDTVYVVEPEEGTVVNHYTVDHRIEGSKVSFKRPDNSWGDWIETQGPTGPQGTQGEKGDKGDPGKDGQDAIIPTFTATAEEGKTPNVTVSQTDTEVALHFTIPTPTDDSDAVTGNEDELINARLVAYPNPAKTTVNIEYYSPDLNSKISLYSQTGAQLMTVPADKINGTVQMNVSKLAKGVYIYKLESGMGYKAGKITVE